MIRIRRNAYWKERFLQSMPKMPAVCYAAIEKVSELIRNGKADEVIPPEQNEVD